MNKDLSRLADELEAVSKLLNHLFTDKNEIVDLLMVCAIAREHLLIIGPPGTAKSEIAKRFALACADSGEMAADGRIAYFEYLLTRFTEPNEIFGPVDIRSFQEGRGHRRMTAGMLPKAEIVFLDEVFKANSAILNALLNILNERVFYNAGRPEPIPLICAVGAANEIPSDPDLTALYDRFPVRVWTDNVAEDHFDSLFRKGWGLVKERISRNGGSDNAVISTEIFHALYGMLPGVRLEPVLPAYREVVRAIRSEGIMMSDRRVIGLLKLVAAAALRDKRTEAAPPDLWILRHIWNTPEQIPHLERILGPYFPEGQDRWGGYRALDLVEDDIGRLEIRSAGMTTDADHGFFLQEASRLRQEVIAHPAAEEIAPLAARLEALIERVLDQI